MWKSQKKQEAKVTEYDNSGALFKNDRKEQERHPDMKGNATIDGVPYWISGWTKTGQRGKFLSLSFQKKDSAPVAAKKEVTLEVDIDDDIPW